MTFDKVQTSDIVLKLVWKLLKFHVVTLHQIRIQDFDVWGDNCFEYKHDVIYMD